ncbi:MAG: helical backbone metal receptor [Burkholderiales bacterium]|jgi:ABC-type Fe3+-hydroxamate transport system substrate-binding protein|nr:helical backbone metal receptor [Burkholderiales bacterium]
MTDDAQAPSWTDAAGHAHPAATGVVRIVSLVPSLTELLFALGLEDRIVGRTGFCIHPKGPVRRVSKVGGTKTVDIPKIRKLGPTHVVVNVDENPRGIVDELATFVPSIVVTHPIDPEDNIGLFRMFGGIFGREARAEELVAAFEDELALTRREMAKLPRETVLYLIWKSPWMTVARDTYISRMLSLVGWDTLPEPATSRYPSVDLDGPSVRGVAHVLLSTEPYSFGERHFADLRAELPTGMHPHLSLIDGAFTSWYGSRSIEALRYLRQFRLLLSQKASH